MFGNGARDFSPPNNRELNAFLGERRLPQSDERQRRLPHVVEAWLSAAHVSDGRKIRFAQLQQEGEMRTSPGGKWMPFTAEQYIRCDPPGFLWFSRVKAGFGLFLTGTDKYDNGKGGMKIRFLSLIPVVNSSGPEIDQGALLRFLAEIAWVPMLARSEWIQWKETDSTHAVATITFQGTTATGTFEFTPDGDFVGFSAMRYMSRRNGATLEKWQVRAEPENMRAFEGVRVPTAFTVTWNLQDGDFTWYRFRVTGMQYF